MNENKLIAEFMELEATPKYNPKEYYVKEYNSGEWYLPEEMKYHKSWDWLMPVVDKCYQEHMSKHIAEAVMTCNIDEAYKVVVEFIKQYNNNES